MSDMTRLPTIVAVLALIAAPFSVRSLSQPASAKNANRSWNSSSTLQDPSGTMNPLRVTESHSENGGRTIDKRKLERLGPGGQYVPYLEIERETVRVNSTTVKTVERSYGTSPDGGRVLLQENREELQKLSGGGEKSVRSTSNPDANGHLQTVQQEVRESRFTGAGARETDSTVLLPDMNGNLSPNRKTHVEERKRSDQFTEYKQTVSLPNANGGWIVDEVREGKITGSEGQSRVKEENVLRPDLDGDLSVTQHTVTKDEKPIGGEKRQVTEMYSSYSPGSSPDGMQLNERVVTVDKTSAGGERTTVQQTQGRNPGDPRAGMRTTSETIDIVRPGTGGTSRQEQMIRSLGGDGKLGTVWVDMGKLQGSPITVDTKNPKATSTKAAPGVPSPQVK
jgi:hypothetical protein